LGSNEQAPDLDWLGIFEALDQHEVRYVVVGGLGAILLGAPIVSLDIDLVPEPSDRNLDRLSLALVSLDTEVMGVGKLRDLGTGDWLRGSRFWNCRTSKGRLDILLAPAGAPAFHVLAQNAGYADAGGGRMVAVASIDHLIAMKEAAGRDKDNYVLPILRWLRDRPQETPPPAGPAAT
jgi:hypothetical protein